MKAPKLLAVSCLLMLLDSAYADDIAPGTTMIDIFGQTAETYDYLITLDYVDGALLKPDDFFNRPSWYDHAAFVAYVLKDKATGIARRNITLLDGGEDPYFQSLRFLRYCDVGVLLLTVEQEFPQGGISADPWLTTYIFRLDTLDMIEQYPAASGTSPAFLIVKYSIPRPACHSVTSSPAFPPNGGIRSVLA